VSASENKGTYRRLAPFRFMQSPSLNGIAFTAQPEAPAYRTAGASGWAVNE
jgi:hypothetical protein